MRADLAADLAVCEAAPAEIETDISYGGHGDCAVPFTVKACREFYELAHAKLPRYIALVTEQAAEIERLRALLDEATEIGLRASHPDDAPWLRLHAIRAEGRLKP